jgi:hypothetical protein
MAFKKPNDYDDIKVGDYRILPAGGYICRILKAEETKSSTGKDMLKVAFDICDGEYTGYFLDQFQDRRAAAEDPATVKWPFNGTKWILLTDSEGKTNRDFKAFCTALEDSGVQVWKNNILDAAGLKDAQIGIIFRREEHEWNNLTSWRTVPYRFRSVESIDKGDYKVPEDKALPATAFSPVDSFSAAEEDIPF